MPPVATFPKRSIRRTLSREDAFKAQGVSLKYPARSWSGVRLEDGVVVLAIRDADVQIDDEGFSCLLWAPVIEGATCSADSPSKQERLEHCRLAALHRGADGLLVCGDSAQVQPDVILALHVAKRRDEYWATWGCPARILPLRNSLNAPLGAGIGA
jgi:hypothetical protein